MQVLFSPLAGDPMRDHTLTGMERHTRTGRSDNPQQQVGFPMRRILTKNFHYIRNFKPDRWPAGDPPQENPPAFAQIATDTYSALPESDAGLTKAFILKRQNHGALKAFAERIFGKRPARELYDLSKDPFELRNLAEDPLYADTLKDLDAKLSAQLRDTGDPRVLAGGDAFESYPAPLPAPKTK